MLRATGLNKSFGKIQAVRDVSLSIGAGETYGLLGPNGAGKSTTISMVVGLSAPDSGEVRILGEPMTTKTTRPRAAIGLVPQEIALYPDLSAKENLAFFGRLYDLGGSELETRATKVIDLIGLAERADDRAKDFSGGMKRRLNIGIALMHEPQLLVLDEPTVGVDPQSRNAILDAVQQLAGEGIAVLYTTHYMEEAQRLCDRIGIIDAGQLKAEGTLAELTRIVGTRDTIHVRASGSLDAAARAVRRIKAVTSVAVADDGLQLVAEDAGSVTAEVLERVSRTGASVTSIEIARPDLETVFLHLTGKALRD